MIDLSRLIQSAEGGDAIGTIARRFGLTPEQAQSAVDALLPAIQMGLQNATRTGAAGSILSQMANPAGGGGTETESASQGTILGSLFGGRDATAGVAQQAAAQSGVSASVIQAMLPTIVSLILGGLFKGAQSGAFGGAIGGILSSVLGGAGGPAPSGGGLGGLIGSVLGSLLGGGNTQAPHTERSGDVPPAGRQPDRPATPATPESVLDELSAMVRSGTPPAPDHEERLAAIIGR